MAEQLTGGLQHVNYKVVTATGEVVVVRRRGDALMRNEKWASGEAFDVRRESDAHWGNVGNMVRTHGARGSGPLEVDAPSCGKLS